MGMHRTFTTLMAFMLVTTAALSAELTAEQRKIADILSTWDAAIEKIEALLATAVLDREGLLRMAEGAPLVGSDARIRGTNDYADIAGSDLVIITAGLARTYAPKVRVNCIMPGPFLTDIAAAWSDDIKAAIGSIVPLGRAGEPEEIVGVALYLASDASRYTTGSVIKVDGGMAYGN